jgi:hypothetical protein
MNKPEKKTSGTNVFIQIAKNFMAKLRQNPDVYPIRYYKKGKQFRRKWQGPIVK